MPTAATALARQKGTPGAGDLQQGASGVNLGGFLLDAQSQHKMDVDISQSITDGYIERTMEGASIISISVNDGTKAILRSGMFGTTDNKKLPVIDVKVDGMWFRLCEFDKQGTNITMVFEDRAVAFLRTHTKPLTASRGSINRAQFVHKMVKEVKKQKINFFCPELHKKQRIEKEKEKKKSARERHEEAMGGLLATADLKIKGAQANKNQLEVLEKVLDAGTSVGANTKVMVSSVMTVIQESNVMKEPPEKTGEGYGPFSQLKNGAWPALSPQEDKDYVTKDALGYFKVAMANDKSKPGISISELCQSVQGSAFPTAYAAWRLEAEKIVEEYGTSGGSTTQTYVKAYEFHRGPPDGPKGENTWEATDRLAKEVNWRRFVVGNTFYFVEDKDLMGRKPTAEISEDTEGVETIDGNISAQVKVSEATVVCRANRWFAPPGSVIKVKDQGPFNGRWLVFKIHRNLFQSSCTITLHQPEAAKPEPAHESASVQSSGGNEGNLVSGGIISGNDPRERIVNAAKWGLANKDKFRYAQVRPMAKSLFIKDAWTKTDCSAFATLCYKAAGLKDPNGFNYNGSGNTVSLKANGNHTNTPEPGDLVFYNNPEHVAVYIGNGKVIELGGTPGPNEEPMNYRAVVDIRNYSLESDAKLPPTPNEPLETDVAHQPGPVGAPHLNGFEEWFG